MLPAVLEKVTFGVAAVLLYTNGRVAGSLVAGGIVDLVFAMLFALAFYATRAREQQRSADGLCGQVRSCGIRGGSGLESSLTSFTFDVRESVTVLWGYICHEA